MTRDRLLRWWKGRKPRERALAITLVAVLVALGGDSLLLKPVRIEIADSKARLATARSELEKLQRIVEERDRAGSETLRAHEANLQARLAAAESQIHRAQIELITPQEMGRQLAAILRKFPQLHVVGMTTEAPALVDESAQKGSKLPDNAEARRSMLFQHGLELTIEGHYADLIAYLEQLEHAPYKIYWRELDLKVDQKGTLVTRIRFFTLSRGPTWLAL